MRDARYDGDPVFPGELPEKARSQNTCRDTVTPAPRCPHCSERVTHRDESANGRAQHFAHCPDAENCGGGSGGGESDPHRWMKNIAEGHLRRILSTVSVARTVIDSEHVPAPVSEKESREPDIILGFEEHDEQLGDGLFVEAQWRHKDKDIARVNDDYFALDREYAVLWITEEHFDTTATDPEEWTCQIGSEKRLRRLVRKQHWPTRVPKRAKWWKPTHTPRKEAFINDDFNSNARDVSIPVTLPEPILDEIQYRESDWSAIFTGHAEDHFRVQVVAHGPTSTLPRPTLSPQTFDELVYQSSEWTDLFTDYPERHYRLQAAIPHVDRGGRTTAFQKAWWLPHSPAEYWRESDWYDRFPDRHGPSTEGYIAQVGYSGNSELVFGAILPLEYLDTKRIEMPDSVPPEPKTVFDDVQCHKCGKYRYAPNAPMKCESCGTRYNWTWNVQSGRISPESLPNDIEI